MLFGEVYCLRVEAARPTVRTMAMIPAPRQIEPSEEPVARCTAAVVTSTGSCRLCSSLSITNQSGTFER